MKKIVLTIAIVLGITLGVSAQNKGLFNRGPEGENQTDSYNRDTEGFLLPGQHGLDTDQSTPLGGGALLLIGFGAAYAIRKKNNTENKQ